MGIRVKGISTVDGSTVEVILEGGSAEEVAGRVDVLEGKVATLETDMMDLENRVVALENAGGGGSP